jgi:hypothetical protein
VSTQTLPGTHGAPGHDETEAERLDRNLGELLQELRVVTVGVQVVFAFLLTVAFSQGESKMSTLDLAIYLAVLLCTAIGAACFMAPVAHHRLVFRRGRKAQLVAFGNVLATVGMSFVAVALCGSLALVSDVLYGGLAATLVGVGAAMVFGALWFVLPVVVLSRDDGLRGDGR